jgi:pimeloyl-ACP methyl ester carboxylesterase
MNRISIFAKIISLCFLLLCWAEVRGQADESEHLRLSVFDLDATPPIGSLLAYDPMEGRSEMGLRARGLVIQGKGLPIVVCAIDWIGIANESHEAFKTQLAKALGTHPERVAVHTVHQHDAPISDFTTESILKDRGFSTFAFDGEWQRSFIAELATSAKTSLESSQPITHIGFGTAEVEKVASNRRIAGPGGKIIHSRTSATRDPEIRAFPEGLIDPSVSLVSFWKEDQPLAVLSYYAVHPQSYYLTKKADPDFPGIARFMRQLDVPEALHIHFNGAGGNVTAGKYNDGSKVNRGVLARRLAEGLAKAWANTEKSPISPKDLDWNYERIFLPVNEQVAQIETEMGEKDQRWLTNHMHRLAWKQLRDQGKGTAISCLYLGNIRILHLPGELFVEYQLYAKSLDPHLKVAMAAYGDYGPFYIGDSLAYEEGGYEIASSPTTWEAERLLKSSIKSLLNHRPQPFGNNPETTGIQLPGSMEAWDKQKSEWKKAMESIMGKTPVIDSPTPSYVLLDSLTTPSYTRYLIRYSSTPSLDVPAYLYIPQPQLREKVPAVIALHSTGALGKGIVDGQSELENRAVGKELAERGYVVLAPDYPSFGDLENHDFSNDGFDSGTLLAIWNHSRGIDLLQSLPIVVPELIGAIGHSLGGHNALFLAAFDERVKATVTSCGWTPFSHYDIGEEASKRYGGRLGPWAQERYMPTINAYLDEDKLPFDFTHIFGSIAPRAVFSSSPTGDSNFSVEGVREAVPVLESIYRYFGIPGNFKVLYPEVGHDFPPEVRDAAYQFLDQHLDLTR